MDMTLIVGLVIIAVLAFGVLAYYNAIVGGFNRAQRAWSDVLVYERKKTKVLDSLLAQASSFKEYERNLIENVTGLRSAITGLPKDADGDALKWVAKGTHDLIGGLRVAFEAYPTLKASEVVMGLMREIADQQENVAAAVTIFNSEVERFNNVIQMFPGSLVNGLLNKKAAINNFADVSASTEFDYRPNF